MLNPTTHLVDKIREQALSLVNIQRGSLINVRTDTQRRRKLSNRDTGSADRGLDVLGFVVTTCKKDFAEQVANCNVATALKGEVDAFLNKLVFASCQRCVEAYEVAFPDAVAEGAEKRFEARESLEQFWAREFVGVDEEAGDEICEDQPCLVSSVCV